MTSAFEKGALVLFLCVDFSRAPEVRVGGRWARVLEDEMNEEACMDDTLRSFGRKQRGLGVTTAAEVEDKKGEPLNRKSPPLKGALRGSGQAKDGPPLRIGRE